MNTIPLQLEMLILLYGPRKEIREKISEVKQQNLH
jgi:hypothetical protein